MNTPVSAPRTLHDSIVLQTLVSDTEITHIDALHTMDTLSLFRRRLGSDLGALAEEHYRHEYALHRPHKSKLQTPT